jgi:hypothetical protein
MMKILLNYCLKYSIYFGTNIDGKAIHLRLYRLQGKCVQAVCDFHVNCEVLNSLENKMDLDCMIRWSTIQIHSDGVL